MGEESINAMKSRTQKGGYSAYFFFFFLLFYNDIQIHI